MARVAAAFTLAMALGLGARLRDGRGARSSTVSPTRWIVVLLNLPALVIIVLAYIWIGLNEAAAIGAVALNKLPNAVVTMREGARTLDPGLDEMARRLRLLAAGSACAMSCCRSSRPIFAAATRSGLSLVWKIVLVVELLGRPNGVGFEIGTAFQLFDVATAARLCAAVHRDHAGRSKPSWSSPLNVMSPAGGPAPA